MSSGKLKKSHRGVLDNRFSWHAYMDWNGDDFWCRDALPIDRANELETAIAGSVLDYSLYHYEAKETATVGVTTGFGARTRYGNNYFEITTVNATDGIHIFKNAGNYNLSTTNGTRYTVVFWLKQVSGLSAGTLLCRLYSNSNANLETSLTVNPSNVPAGMWIRNELAFTASASNNLTLQIYSTESTAVVFHVSGLMLFSGLSRIPVGYNTGALTASGQLLDGYDNISDDLRKMNWFLGMRKPYQDVCDEQTATVTLFNGDQKYTPENPASPIYGKLLNGRKINIEYEIDGGRIAEYPMYVGRCDFSTVKWQVGENAGKLDVTLPFTWYTKMMKENQVDLGLYTNSTAGTIIRNGIIGGVYDLPTNLIEDGITTIPYYGDSATQTEWSTIVELTGAERGRFFVARDGRATFWDRHHLLDADSATATATVNSTYLRDGYPPNALEYTFGTSMYNSIRVKVTPRQIGTNETLWELDSDITIEPSETKEFFITLRRSTGQFAASGSLALSGATYSSGTTTNGVTAYGGRAKIALANASTTTAAVLTALVVQGTPQSQQNALEYLAKASDSVINTYGRRELTINLAALNSANAAQDVAEFELIRRNQLTGDVLWISYKHASDGLENYHQYTWGIGTRLTVVLPELFHSRDYFIMGEEHSWDVSDLGHHKTKFYLEPCYPLAFWIIGVAGNSEIGETTYVGY